MPIYSNIASTLARQGPKVLNYGYAQSVIAATHPQVVYASQNRAGLSRHRANKISLFSSLQLQNAFHNAVQTASASAHVRNERFDGGLDAYFEAWRKTHVAGEPEREWTQFQFAKRIEWEPGSISVENEIIDKIQSEKLEEEHRSESSVLEANDDIIAADKVTASTKVNIIEKETEIRSKEATLEAKSSPSASQCSPSTSQTLKQKHGIIINKITNSTSGSSNPFNVHSQRYEDHLISLLKNHRYGEIPAVFKAMLLAGVHPRATAYNALLEAAIHIPDERTNAVPKALDIYSDMLRRRVLPNTKTYEKILTILASRTLEVHISKKKLEEKRVRFGGIELEGKFMLTSSEIENAILVEDNRIDVLTQIYDTSVVHHKDRKYSVETFDQLIAACSAAGRINHMTQIFEHMKKLDVLPKASTFCHMINGVAQIGDLDKAVGYYDMYKKLVIDHENDSIEILDRQDYLVYASLIKAYVTLDRIPGAIKFYNKIIDAYSTSNVSIAEALIYEGLIPGLIERHMPSEALKWAESLTGTLRHKSMANLTTAAADLGMRSTAETAFAHLLQKPQEDIILPAISMLALSVREGRAQDAEYYWQILSHPLNVVSSLFIEPTAMFTVAMIGSGKVLEGLVSAEEMFDRIRKSAIDTTGHLHDEVDEGIAFINNFMSSRGICDPRSVDLQHTSQNFGFTEFAPVSMCEDSFDPYANKTDYKGSSIISDELDQASAHGKSAKLGEVLRRFRNIRRAGRHPRYITYAKLISATAREKRMDLVQEILGMARTDVPLLQQYPNVRYGWITILDAMIGACLTLGDRNLAAQYHQELLSIGAIPTANTFGLYITTLKGCTKTYDEATDAINIFNQAKNEGVKPSSFLYNALIGKLGKARRIDDCLYYFHEMRYLGIRPTSVTYGTIVNALCRVSDERLAELLFEEMESMPNYKPRPAPYNSLMQFFLNTKREKSKVLSYFERMMKKGIKPTSHTYKLLVDAHATLDPINMAAAEAVLDIIRRTGQKPEAVHYSSLIHAKGCVMHDIDGAKAIFDSVIADPSIHPQACLYQALFEAMVSNHLVGETEPILQDMPQKGVEMTPYIANTLIHGWTSEFNISKAESIYTSVNCDEREPSTYDAMIRAYLAVENRLGANSVVQEMLGRNYPTAVSTKICELLGDNNAEISD